MHKILYVFYEPNTHTHRAHITEKLSKTMMYILYIILYTNKDKIMQQS